MYSPTGGNIFINNKDINVINRISIRNKIGIVSQKIFLFKGTVLDNILYGHNNKTRKDVEKLLKKYSLDEYINMLPDGLDTKISQNSSGVSGGQAQITAFIRAILEKKDIIILDEPLSNVDIQTQKLILKIIKKIENYNILIIISHQQHNLDFITKTINLSKK